MQCGFSISGAPSSSLTVRIRLQVLLLRTHAILCESLQPALSTLFDRAEPSSIGLACLFKCVLWTSCMSLPSCLTRNAGWNVHPLAEPFNLQIVCPRDAFFTTCLFGQAALLPRHASDVQSCLHQAHLSKKDGAWTVLPHLTHEGHADPTVGMGTSESEANVFIQGHAC